MNIRIIPQGQECAIAPSADAKRHQVACPWPSVLPLEPDDAAFFARDPSLDYIIRDWRLSDDQDTGGLTNATDMHALTIVFRSGRRAPRFHAIPLRRHRHWRHPLGRTHYAAEVLFRDGSEGVEASDRKPRGLVTALAGLVGLPAEEARQRLAIIATAH